MKLLFIDTETTGTNSKINGLYQLSGAIVIDNEVKEVFNYKIQPFDGAVIEQEALDINGYTKEDLYGPEFIQENLVYQTFTNLLSKYVNKYNKYDKFFLVGYNVHFDKDFIYNWFVRCSDNYLFSFIWGNHIDVMVLATTALLSIRPQMVNFKQGTVAKQLGFDVKEDNLHDALYDITICLALYNYLTKSNIKCSELQIQNQYDVMLNSLSTKTTEEQIIDNGLKTVMPFGKYKGQTIQQIIETNKQYLIWVHDNISGQTLISQEMFEYIQKLIEDENSSQNIQ